MEARLKKHQWGFKEVDDSQREGVAGGLKAWKTKEATRRWVKE